MKEQHETMKLQNEEVILGLILKTLINEMIRPAVSALVRNFSEKNLFLL